MEFELDVKENEADASTVDLGRQLDVLYTLKPGRYVVTVKPVEAECE